MLRVNKINHSSKFDNMTFSENGLVLKYKNKPQREISFEDVDQIYIKKYKLHPVMKLIGIVSPFLLIYLTLQYFPFDLVIIAGLFTIVPVFMSIINYKWYRLCIRLKDGTTCRKKVPLHLKTENISVLNKVRTEYLYYKARPFASASFYF